MLYDVESRMIVARERAALLEARFGPGDARLRSWLSARLIAAGEWIAPSRKCESALRRSNSRTRAAY